MQVITKDSKKHNRSLQINGFVKPSGIVCASVTTDKGAQYFVVIKAAKSTCTCEGNRTWGRQCYHIREVKALAFPTFSQVAGDEPSREGKYAERLQEWTLHNAQDAYTILGTTKKPVHGWGCCGHIVKSEHDGQLCGACMCK